MATLTFLLLASGSGSRPAQGATTATALGGSAGTVISLPSTPSAMTVGGTAGGPFATLKITVNQTQGLVNQAISVTWTGGTPSTVVGGKLVDNFLQLMQCWTENAQAPPTPEQCEFGAEADSIIGTPPQVQVNPGAYPVVNWTNAVTRILSSPGQTCSADTYAGCQGYSQLAALAATTPSKAYLDLDQFGDILDPFQPVSGSLVPVTSDEKCCLSTPPWLDGSGNTISWDQNPWFNHTTSNEVDLARTYPDGTGQVLFQVDTANEAPGLGCGEAETFADDTTGIPQCWLVIVPRGSATAENTAGSNQAGASINTSPLSPGIWGNHIAVPLGFQPVGTGCSSSATVRRILGGELASAAVHSWQPSLCQAQTSSAYLYTGLSDDSVRTDILSPDPDVVAGALTYPLAADEVDPSNPFVYAPLTLSGVAIALNIQRVPIEDASKYPSPGFPPDEIPYIGRPLTQVNLTPRLVAKLLTESYAAAFGPDGEPASDASTWAAGNPQSLFLDPDFLQYNPEFAELDTDYPTDASQLVVSEPASDATTVLWDWILADPAAKSWLQGNPDHWGMKVNPYYALSGGPETNPLTFALPTDTYPKNDPYCFTPTGSEYAIATTPPQEARPLCQQDWAPYTGSMSATAAALGTANSGAHTTFNPVALTGDNAWSATGPQTYEEQSILGVTTTDQAARYGLVTASLSQAGDDGATPTFIAPDAASLTAGEGAMQPSGVTGVVIPNPGTNAAGAYPLAILSYAVIAPLALDSGAQQDTAAFLDYAAGAGQTAGYSLGDLPAGYAPLPSALVAQAKAAAATVLNPSSLEPTTTTTAPTTTTSTTAAPTTTNAAPTTTVEPTTATTAATTAAAGPTTTPVATSPPVEAPAGTGSPAAPVAREVGASVTTTLATRRRPTAPTIPYESTTTTRPPGSPGKTVGSHPGASRYAVMAALLVGLGSAAGSGVLLRR